MRTIHRAAVATIAATLLLGALVTTQPASAATLPPLTTLTCYQTITESIRVANDLTCPGGLLIARTPGTTIDLNGHTLTSTNNIGCGWSLSLWSCSIDIGSGVTLTNGKLRNTTVSARGGQVTDVQATGTQLSFLEAGLHDSTIVDSKVLFFAKADISHNRFLRSPLVLENCCIAGRDFSVSDNVIRNSTYTRRGATSGSIVIVDDWHAQPYDISGQIVRNDIRGSAGSGVVLKGGVVLGQLLIAQNTVVNNRGDGIYADGTPFWRPDIDPPSGPVTIQDNLAVRNGGHGIVFAGTIAFIDGGGNAAHNNALDPQCVGLVCTRR